MRKKQQIICNQCGRKIQKHRAMLMEDIVSVEMEWGYFSSKDGQIHQFDLCESCYDLIQSGFSIAPTVVYKKEMI